MLPSACCSVLQNVVVRRAHEDVAFGVLQCVALSVLQCVAFGVLQCVAVCRSADGTRGE